MRFMIYHYRFDQSDKPPIKGATWSTFTRIDERTSNDPAKIPAYKGQDPAWWYSEGTNHRIEHGHIMRDFPDTEAWFIEVADLDALMRLYGKYGSFTLESAQGNVRIPCLNFERYWD